MVYVLLILSGFGAAFFLLPNKHRTSPQPSIKASTQTTSTDGTTLRIEETNLFFDFENAEELSNSDPRENKIVHSGKYACDFSGGKEYGPSVVKKIREISSDSLKKICMSIWVYPLTEAPNTVLTVSVVNSKNETVFWDGKSTENGSFPKNKWSKLNACFLLPIDKISPDDFISAGIWNRGKTAVFIDDLEIVYGESPERRGTSSTIDAVAIYEKRFVAEKNKPPFPVIYFEKQEIGNENTVSITPPSKQAVSNNFSPCDEFLVGDFISDKNKLEEIICIKKQAQGLFYYTPDKKQFERIWENTNPADSIWNKNNTYYAVDYNNDGKQEVLLVNKGNGDWGIIEFNGQKWQIIKGGTQENLNKKWIEKTAAPSAPVINSSDLLFAGNYCSTNKQWLKLNQDWKFDLKLLEQDKNDFTILGNIDFKGYPADHNPKYYELVEIISGKFMNKNRTSLLVLMANCKDASFIGITCTELENLSFLPNSTQLYSIPE